MIKKTAVYALDKNKEEALNICSKLKCDILNEISFLNTDFILSLEENYKLLINPKLNLGRELEVNFETYKKKFKNLKNSNLYKAIFIKNNKNLKVLDATGGLAMDSFKIFLLGASVKIVEENTTLFYLINNAIRSYPTKNKLKVINSNSIEIISNLESDIDVIYLDPMFEIKKKSAKVKKELQILQNLIGPPIKEEELLKVSLNSNVKRVVVKRMLKAPPIISNKEVDFSYSGKTSRYDVYNLNHSRN